MARAGDDLVNTSASFFTGRESRRIMHARYAHINWALEELYDLDPSVESDVVAFVATRNDDTTDKYVRARHATRDFVVVCTHEVYNGFYSRTFKVFVTPEDEDRVRDFLRASMQRLQQHWVNLDTLA
jgi:hypothetical protein